MAIVQQRKPHPPFEVHSPISTIMPPGTLICPSVSCDIPPPRYYTNFKFYLSPKPAEDGVLELSLPLRPGEKLPCYDAGEKVWVVGDWDYSG